MYAATSVWYLFSLLWYKTSHRNCSGPTLHSASRLTGLGLLLRSCRHHVSSGMAIPVHRLGTNQAPWPEGPHQPTWGQGSASAHHSEGPSAKILSPAPEYLSTATTKYPCKTQKPKSPSTLDCSRCVCMSTWSQPSKGKVAITVCIIPWHFEVSAHQPKGT